MVLTVICASVPPAMINTALVAAVKGLNPGRPRRVARLALEWLAQRGDGVHPHPPAV